MDNIDAKVYFTIPEQKLIMNQNAQHLVSEGESALSKKPEEVLSNLEFEKVDGEPRYVVFHERQKGGMSHVYKGADMNLHIPVAVKILDVEPLAHSVLPGMLEKEAKSQARFNHPNIVKIHNIVRASILDREEPDNIVIMEWMEPKDFPTLKSIIDQGKAGDPKLILRVARTLGNAITYMSLQQFYHKDIKPGNVFVGKNIIKLGDFGIGNWVVDPGDTALGSPAYMSPEAIRAENVDERSEVFSMAQTIYAMVAGHAPFEVAKNVQKTQDGILVKDYPPLAKDEALKDKDNKMLSSLDAVLSKAMQKMADDRYQTVEEFCWDLELALRPFVGDAWLKNYRLYYGL